PPLLLLLLLLLLILVRIIIIIIIIINLTVGIIGNIGTLNKQSQQIIVNVFQYFTKTRQGKGAIVS
ncbi:hypothetical protein C0J52_22723, partial [Blattella germanica]